MHPGRGFGYVRPGGVNIDLPTEVRSPNSGPCTTSRRIVRSLKNPLACVTQLVPLDNGENSRPPHLFSRLNTASIPSEASASEVRSELCSIAMEEQTDDSVSSFFDHRRSRHGRKVSSSMSRSRASRAGHGSRARMRRSLPSSGSREVEESFLSYSDDPSFYACDSDASSESAETEGSSQSISFTAISESVPSCSLTCITESKTAATGWASRFRRPNAASPQKESNSFGSIFGSGGIDPYNGVSVNAHHQSRDSAAAGVTLGGATVGPRIMTAASQRDQPMAVVSSSSSVAQTHLARQLSATAASAAKNAPGATAPKADDGASQIAEDTAPVEGARSSIPQNSSFYQRPRVQSVKLQDRVGRGTFGDVYRGQDLDSGMIIAVKEIIVPHDFTKDVEKQLAALESEIRVMRRLHHPHVVTYLGAVREKNSLRIFMEYVGGGTVGNKVALIGGLSEEKTRDYTAQLLEGLEYLHASHILHRDLKGDNLFLTEDDQLKLGDFGQSKELADTLTTQSVQGTPSFMSPEMIACSGYSFEADVWSVGCCVIQMLTGKPPFANLDNQMAVMFAIISSKIHDQIPASASEGAKDFIRMCTKTNIKDRWTASQLRQHPWLLGKDIPTPATPSADLARSSGDGKGEPPLKPMPKHVPLRANEPTPSATLSSRHARSMLLDTAALAGSESVDDTRKGPSNSNLSGYPYSYGDEAGDHEAGGNTSSNLSSSKSETQSFPNVAATKHIGVPRLQSSTQSEGASADDHRPSPLTMPGVSPKGGRLHRAHGTPSGAPPTQPYSVVVVGDECGGGGGGGARGRRRSPLEPLQGLHRPVQSHSEKLSQDRSSTSSGVMALDSSSKRRSNPSPLLRTLPTPTHSNSLGSTSTSLRTEIPSAGSTVYRGSLVGNHSSRKTSTSTSFGRKRHVAASRATGHSLKDNGKI